MFFLHILLLLLIYIFALTAKAAKPRLASGLPDVAIQAIFDSKLVETPIDNGLDIQNSSLVGDKTTITLGILLHFHYNTLRNISVIVGVTHVDGTNQDYLLQIDINSLKANGVTSGSDLAKAIVDITTDCFDFHYTQYAADGNKLWVYDDRSTL